MIERKTPNVHGWAKRSCSLRIFLGFEIMFFPAGLIRVMWLQCQQAVPPPVCGDACCWKMVSHQMQLQIFASSYPGTLPPRKKSEKLTSPRLRSTNVCFTHICPQTRTLPLVFGQLSCAQISMSTTTTTYSSSGSDADAIKAKFSQWGPNET